MSLFDDLENPELLKARVGGVCTVCKFIAGLTDTEAEKFTDLLSDRTVAKTSIAKILAKNGYKIPANALNRHARGECIGDLSR